MQKICRDTGIPFLPLPVSRSKWPSVSGIPVSPKSSYRYLTSKCEILQADFLPYFAGTPWLRPNSEWGDSWTVGKLYESTFKPNWPHLHSLCNLREMSLFLSVGQIFSRLINPNVLFFCSGPSLNLPKLLESTSKLRRLSSTALRDLGYFRIQPGIIWSFGHTF